MRERGDLERIVLPKWSTAPYRFGRATHRQSVRYIDAAGLCGRGCYDDIFVSCGANILERSRRPESSEGSCRCNKRVHHVHLYVPGSVVRVGTLIEMNCFRKTTFVCMQMIFVSLAFETKARYSPPCFEKAAQRGEVSCAR
jgi:hypothetical protein